MPGPRPNRLYICPHAQDKAKERNVDEQDIKKTLYYPNRTKPAREKGRFKAERGFSLGAYTVQVVYSIEEDEFGPIFNVVTVMKRKRKGGRQ